MPGILRMLLGLLLILVTVGLTTCQSMLKAEPAARPPIQTGSVSP